MTKHHNIIGPQVRKYRLQRKLTQEMLAAKCATAGWDMSRITLAKIEARLRYVSDIEIFFLTKVLTVKMEDLFPQGQKISVYPSFDRKQYHHLKAK